MIQVAVVLMSSLVTMETVSLKALSVITMMTVEITVTKRDVVCNGRSIFICMNVCLEPYIHAYLYFKSSLSAHSFI